MSNLKLPPKSDFSDWYQEILFRTSIVDKRIPDSRGFYGYPPYGAQILQLLEDLFIQELNKTGHFPIRTPTVIPETLLEIEKEHAEGFAPEVWQITHGRNNEELNIKKVLRPTGETIIYSLFAYWIRSHADLPLKTYEVRSVFRAEPDKAVFPLMRTHEFYWIEAHDVQENLEEADAQVKEDIGIFENVIKNKVGLPFKRLKRPEWDKFAGAIYTCAYDVPLPDGKVLQIGTTHNLGQNFSKAFDIKFESEEGQLEYSYQTCFGPGISRILGGIVSIHGDDLGLILPPAIAPIQIVIIPIPKKGWDEKIEHYAKKTLNLLKKEFRIHIDTRDITPGRKYYEWEEKGVPLRIEIGSRETEGNKLMVVKRFNREKIKIDFDSSITKLKEIIEKYPEELLKNVNVKMIIDAADNYDDMIDLVEKNTHLIEIPFCDEDECVEFLKDELNIKVRGVPLFEHGEKTVEECEKSAIKRAKGKTCIICNENAAKRMVYIARQY
ncbi:MAG: proline--tRNA ligase [Promethearchaeota archaeon]|nr:MAG: proline--tRNA ligase [Candidatus Lokiarchaeota archaeon]